MPAGRGSPGSPRCGSRRTPLSASRGGASPGGTALPERLRCAPLCPGPRPEKLRGDPGRAGAWEGGGGCARRPPHPAPRRPRVAPLPGAARLEGKKKPDGEEGLLKTTNKTPFLADFDFTSVSRSPSHTPILPALPPFRGRGLVRAASGSPAAGKRRGGSIPILPRGNGAKFAVNLPLPFTACGKGPCRRLVPPGSGQGSALQGGGRPARRQGDPPTPEKRGGTGAVRPRPASPSGALPGGGDRGGMGFPPRPGAAPGRCRGAPTTCGPGSRSPPRRPRRDYSSRQPAGCRAGHRPISGARRVARGLNGGRARGGVGEPPAGGRRGLPRRLCRPPVLIFPLLPTGILPRARAFGAGGM